MAALSIVGPIDNIAVGYAGQCGSMNTVATDAMGKFRVSAGKTVFLQADSHRGRLTGLSCGGPLSFHAEPDAEYRLTAVMFGQPGCVAEMKVRRPGRDWVLDTSFRILERRRCLPWE